MDKWIDGKAAMLEKNEDVEAANLAEVNVRKKPCYSLAFPFSSSTL